MLLIKNTIYFGLLSYLYLMNIDSYLYYLIMFKIFISNYLFIKPYIVNNEYFKQIKIIMIMVTCLDSLYKNYILLVMNCFNFIIKFTKKITFTGIISTKDFKTKDDINNFLSNL
jgi:hypothetical protein